jgi:hypothetical protein
MEMEWLQFILALIVLFYPLNSGSNSRVRLLDYEGARNQLGASGACVWWRQFSIWADPLRACMGTWLCVHAFRFDPVLPGLWLHSGNVGILLVLCCAVAVQMHTRRGNDVVLAPIGFSAGVVFAFLPPHVAVLIVIFAGASLVAFRKLEAYFICGAMCAGVLGYLILGVQHAVVGAVVLTLQPVLLSTVTYRRMRLPLVRKPLKVKVVGPSLGEAHGTRIQELVREPQY